MRMEWELVLFFGAPLVWGAWQLWSLRRDRTRAGQERADRTRKDHDGAG